MIIKSLADRKLVMQGQQMHCRLPRPYYTVCKVQGCSFAQTAWGSEILTDLSLSKYHPSSTDLL